MDNEGETKGFLLGIIKVCLERAVAVTQNILLHLVEGILEEPLIVDVLACINSQSHCSKFIPGCSISLSSPWS